MFYTTISYTWVYIIFGKTVAENLADFADLYSRSKVMPMKSPKHCEDGPLIILNGHQSCSQVRS